MNIKNYFFEIKEKINKINNYVSNPINYRNIRNPFTASLTKTYVWFEDENRKKTNQ